MNLSEMQINNIVNESIRKMLPEKNHTKWIKIKHFHPEGLVFPNGSHYQRGGYLRECRKNLDSFVLDEGVHDTQHGMSDNRGGIIVFSTDINALKLDDNKVLNKIRQILTSYKKDSMIKSNDNGGESIGAYSVGNFFKGKYVGDNGKMFADKSLSIEINGLSRKSLLKMAEMLAQEFLQETVLVKDLNKNKIYLADSIPTKDSTSLNEP